MNKRTKPIAQIIIHASYSPTHLDIGADTIRQWHLERGFDDIGYHYVIRRDGTVEKGRPLEYIGAHCLGQNSDSIGICLVGGWEEKFDYTQFQMRALDDLVSSLLDTYGTIKKIAGHNEYTRKKACPCFNVAEFYKYDNMGLSGAK